MMTLGSIGFLEPLLLTGLLALPLIWWLLHFTPPRPKLVVFPPTRLLRDIEDNEQTAEHSPWWLTLLRMIMAALIILALARPLIHPDRETLAGDGPLLIAIDNGWASAAHWDKRMEMLSVLLDRAERDSRAVIIAPTASPNKSALAPMGSDKAREVAASLLPLPFEPRRRHVAQQLALDIKNTQGLTVYWLSDGLDYGNTALFMKEITKLAGGSGKVNLIRPENGTSALALYGEIGEGGVLTANLTRAGDGARSGIVAAYSSRGETLGRARFELAQGVARASARFNLPLEIRNQITRLEIAGEKSAGAVHLLDSRSQWRRVGIISGETRELAQPLLSPLYYVERALAPYSEVVSSPDGNIASAVRELLERNLSVLVLADIGQLVPGTLREIEDWVSRGGTLMRFAGARLEKSADELMPVPLRRGGRTLGGSLSWSEAQPLAPFDEKSPFHGLDIRNDIKVHRQVLADPAAQIKAEIWARLTDGTPLVSASKRGNGRIVLFHVTANSDWSNLPLSGLFVEMLRRVVENSVITPGRANGSPAASPAQESRSDTPDVLAPLQVLDGFGHLGEPAVTTQPLKGSALEKAKTGPDHPPGYYGPAGTARALNIISANTILKPLPSMPGKTAISGYEVRQAIQLKPWLLAGALGAFLMDMIAVLLLASGFGMMRAVRRGAAVLLFGTFILPLAMDSAQAQQNSSEADKTALEASLQTRMAYVLTGDADIDTASETGLTGLGKVLTARTAIEPGAPVGVNVDKDELAFFPLLYWPVREDAQKLPDATLARIDAYMKQGGLILFDTRDYQQSIPTGGAGRQGPGAKALSRLLGKLDIPPLEPVPEKHVLTKSFYLLRNFPGRWDGGTLWVEARAENADARARQSRRADGVSSLLITSNDFAAAWALDDANRPLYPVVPGGDAQREMAFRVGVNIVMYALTGNYKADQVHIPALLERLGQ